MRPSPPVRLDAEVIELLRDSPELLAIADAISATQTAPATRRRATRLAAVAAVLGVAVALALVSPWSGRASLVDRALAAIGSGEVIHVVQRADVPEQTLVDLRTGAESPVVSTRELWFDGERGLLRSLQRIGDTVTSEVLETPQGAWTEAGRVYTCAWIAAHPVEATKARVSCNPSGENGTTPRRVPEPRPALDPALAGFVTGYRDALASGEATRDGQGTLDGRAVEWLRFALPRNTGPARTERVAVDAATYLPVQVETLVADKLVSRAAVSVAETLDRASVTFTRPKPVPSGSEPISSRVVNQATVSDAQADAALDGQLVDPGDAIAGLPLHDTTLRTIVSSYGAGSDRQPTQASGVELLYGGPIDPALEHPYVLVKESRERLMMYQFRFFGTGNTPPPQGTLAVATSDVHDATAPGRPARSVGTLYTGNLRVGDVYITIDATSKPLLLDTARTLAGTPRP